MFWQLSLQYALAQLVCAVVLLSKGMAPAAVNFSCTSISQLPIQLHLMHDCSPLLQAKENGGSDMHAFSKKLINLSIKVE